MPSRRKPGESSRHRYPTIRGWAPLEIAEQTLFPTIDPRDLTPAQRAEALAYAKQLFHERTGILLNP